MKDDDAIRILDESVARARAGGVEVEGWTMQSGEDGYVAWLYGEDEDGQTCLFSEVEILSTALAAAQACLERAAALGGGSREE